MSWSVNITSTPVADVEAKLADATTAYQKQLASADYDLDSSAKEQIEVAHAAVKAIVASGAVGSGLVNVTISGHANPDHKPTKGWANDLLTVSVGCADPQPTA